MSQQSASFHIYAQALVGPNGEHTIRLTLPGGVTYEFPTPRQDAAPNYVHAEYYFGGDVEVRMGYPDARPVNQRIPLSDLPPHEYPR